MRDPAGDAVRVDPTSEFREGDRIRLVLEPNTDGFLYVFHTENDAQPQMLFPDPRLDGGTNRVRAHVPCEVPSSREANEQLRWFSSMPYRRSSGYTSSFQESLSQAFPPRPSSLFVSRQ
ncbi:MAG: DUF4384 domain-containing protein [Pyrinomonadaceae bacterium]